ncbi:MAG: glutathione S-transferase family protein, partial [Candidatus Competibacteraceae bacterium]|nr:glutathione S-transferase family protein [Candidatus Competibacteraceae bacterium]
DALHLIETTLSPVSPNAALNADNPIGKVPALVLDDGSVLYDSPVICEYLDTLHTGPRWFPDGPERWDALRRQALADGILDAAVISRYEAALRPEALRWDDWLSGQQQKIIRALDQLEQTCGQWGERLDIGTLTIACALGYLDFRFADLDWRSEHPQLSAWFASFSQRPSIVSTVPTA